MNFIIRNLGWVLLFFFFIFMLFLISSNDNKASHNKFKTGVVQTNTGEENLENLVEKLEKQDIKDDEKNDEKDKEDEKDIDNKISFFERIFGKKKDLTKEILLADSGSVSASGATKGETKIVPTEKNSIVVPADLQKKPTGTSLSKDTLGDIVSTEENTKNISLPQISQTSPSQQGMTSQVGNKYTIAVQALKLNNKTFTQTLGYLQFADVVEQIGVSDENACFEVKVIQAKNTKNIEKTGYVCQKYLSAYIPGDAQSVEEVVIQEEKTGTQNIVDLSLYPQTKIGDIITLTKTTQLVLKEYTDLSVGDTIDQMTNFDAYGCFIAHVYSSAYASSRDMVGRICLKDIY